MWRSLREAHRPSPVARTEVGGDGTLTEYYKKVGLRYAHPTYETRNTKRLSMNSMDELPAFPEGWYFVIK